MKDFNQRVAAITGAASGIGRALAVALAADGCHLALSDVDEAGLDETVDGLRLGDNVVWQVDSVDDFDAVLKVHLRGTWIPCKHAALHWRALNKETGQKVDGRIINTVSGAGLTGNFGQSNYAPAKAAIASLTQTLSLELYKMGVTVNAVAPGLVATPWTKDWKDLHENVKNTSPLKRSATTAGRLASTTTGAAYEVVAIALQTTTATTASIAVWYQGRPAFYSTGTS